MSKPRPWLWWVWGVLATLGTAYSLLPGDIADRLSRAGTREHGFSFAALSLVGVAAAGSRRWIWPVGMTLALGLAIEFAQRLVPGRAFEWEDIGADLEGVLVGLAAAMLFWIAAWVKCRTTRSQQ